MKSLSVVGLLFQLLGTWFLCRFFYKLDSLKWGQTEPWETRVKNNKWDRFWSKFGSALLWARGLPWEQRMEDIKLTADPNATFAFLLIGIGATFQILGILLG